MNCTEKIKGSWFERKETCQWISTSLSAPHITTQVCTCASQLVKGTIKRCPFFQMNPLRPAFAGRIGKRLEKAKREIYPFLGQSLFGNIYEKEVLSSLSLKIAH